jgi:tRNA (guanine37-N1)-methyltransferase
LSIGDYVLSSGEPAAMVIVDAVFRLVEGSITPESLEEESFSDGLLEYPHYTRPQNFRGSLVPDILLSGNHEAIRRWRLQERNIRTRARRRDIKGKEDDGLD